MADQSTPIPCANAGDVAEMTVEKAVDALKARMNTKEYAAWMERIYEKTYRLTIAVPTCSDPLYVLTCKDRPSACVCNAPANLSAANRVAIPRLGDLCEGVDVQLFPGDRIASAVLRANNTLDDEWVPTPFAKVSENGRCVYFDPPIPLVNFVRFGLEIYWADGSRDVPLRACVINYVYLDSDTRNQFLVECEPLNGELYSRAAK